MTATPEQLHAALMYCVDFAKIMLKKSGAFHPFGSIINTQGSVEAMGAWTGEEHPEGQAVHDFLVRSLRTRMMDGTAIALAVAADVNIPEEYAPHYKDGIRVSLETHGYSRFVYMPYRISRRGFFGMDRFVELSEPFSVELTPSI